MSRLFVSEISVILQKSDSPLTASDWQTIESFSSERRRTEQFAWRLLLRRSLRKMGYDDVVLSADIDYDSVGAPYLVGCDVCIGVSHSHSHIAIIVGDEPCAVDIELCSRNFNRIESRFVNPSEGILFSKYHQESFSLPIIWSAKETLYKLSGATGLDLIDDIVLESLDMDMCSITGYVTKGRFANYRFTLNFCFNDDQVIVWAIS